MAGQHGLCRTNCGIVGADKRRFRVHHGEPVVSNRRLEKLLTWTAVWVGNPGQTAGEPSVWVGNFSNRGFETTDFP